MSRCATERRRARIQEEYTNVTDVSASDVDGEKSASLGSALSTPFVRVILRLIPAIIIVTSICMFVTGIMKFDELERERAELERQIEKIEYEIDELEYLIESPIDYDYIVRVAREKLNLHLPDEIVYYNDIND